MREDLRPRGSDRLSNPIGQAQRQRDDRVGRVGETACREDGGAGDEEVGDAVNSAVGVDDAISRIFRHACGTHVVAGVNQAGDLRGVGRQAIEVGYGIMNGKKPENPMILLPSELITRDNVAQYKGW